MRLPRRRLLLVLGFWIVPALVATLGLRLVPSRLNPDLTSLEILITQAIIWCTWGLWALVILSVGDRFPFERGRIMRALAVHLPLSAVVIGSQIVVVFLVSIQAGMREPLGLESILFIGIRAYGDLFTVIYWGIVGMHGAFRWHSAWQAQALVNARLGDDLAEAQLAALRGQLNPHFLFNALNSVVALIERDAAQAQRTVIRLADLLRTTLRAAESQEIPLSQELEMAARYLDLELVRFADRLTVEWDIAPPTRQALVPSFALQPLVENAIQHGIAPHPGPGTIVIAARREGADLVLTVRNTGHPSGNGPRQGDADDRTRIGLTNLRARLHRLYGPRGNVELTVSSEGSAQVVVRIPCRESRAPARSVPGLKQPAPSPAAFVPLPGPKSSSVP